MVGQCVLVTLERPRESLMLARINRLLSLTLFIGLISGLQGCACWFSDEFQDPEVSLVKVDVIKARLLEQQFILRFRIDNPNDTSIPVRGFNYNLELNSLPLAHGESSEWFSVPARGHQIFDVPVRTNLWRHLKGIVRALEDTERPVRYSLRGEVETGLLFGRSVHLARNGEIIPGHYIPEESP